MTLTPLDAPSIQEALSEKLPGLRGLNVRVEEVQPMSAHVRLVYDASQLRPGGTISGPSMMTLADTAMYVAILGTVGPEWLALTTDLNIHFLRRPQPVDLHAKARILKLGRKLVVMDVAITAAGELVAQASGTYARPPENRQP